MTNPFALTPEERKRLEERGVIKFNRSPIERKQPQERRKQQTWTRRAFKNAEERRAHLTAYMREYRKLK